MDAELALPTQILILKKLLVYAQTPIMYFSIMKMFAVLALLANFQTVLELNAYAQPTLKMRMVSANQIVLPLKFIIKLIVLANAPSDLLMSEEFVLKDVLWMKSLRIMSVFALMGMLNILDPVNNAQLELVKLAQIENGVFATKPNKFSILLDYYARHVQLILLPMQIKLNANAIVDLLLIKTETASEFQIAQLVQVLIKTPYHAFATALTSTWLVESAKPAQLTKVGMENNVFVFKIITELTESVELAILDQLIMARIVFVMLVSLEIETNVKPVILLAVNVQVHKLVNALLVQIFL